MVTRSSRQRGANADLSIAIITPGASKSCIRCYDPHAARTDVSRVVVWGRLWL